MLCLVKQKKRSRGGLLEKTMCFLLCRCQTDIGLQLGILDRWVCLCATLLLVPEMQVSTWHRGVEPFTCSLESFLNIFRCLFLIKLINAPLPTTLLPKASAWDVLAFIGGILHFLGYKQCFPKYSLPTYLLGETVLTLLGGDCRSYGSSITCTLS